MLGNKAYVDMVTSDAYTERTYYMGTVDDQNRVNFYDGQVRVVDPEGKEFVKYHARGLPAARRRTRRAVDLPQVPLPEERRLEGLRGRAGQRRVLATPLSRLNAADGMATPQAQAAFEKIYETLGSKKVDGRYQPVHFRLATHWARLIELLYAAERMLELAAGSRDHRPERAGPVTAHRTKAWAAWRRHAARSRTTTGPMSAAC